MNWDDLRIFLAVARAGQIAKAAAALRIDPTTVSRRLRRLQTVQGEILIEQHPDGHRLTTSGHRLLMAAETVESQMTRLSARRDDAAPIAGLVRVSASEGFGTWFIAGHLGSLGARYPEMSVDLVATTGFLNPSKHETDVAILLAQPRKGPLVTRKLTDYGLRVYASRSYLARHPAIRQPADLADHTLVGYIPDIIYAPELRYLHEISPALEPRLRSSSINAQYRLIREEAGVGVLPCFIGDADPSLRVVLPDVHLQRSFWLATHRDVRDIPRVKHFVDWLVALTSMRREQLLGANDRGENAAPTGSSADRHCTVDPPSTTSSAPVM